MFETRFLKALKRLQKSKNPDNETTQAIDKIQRQERLSSEEFLKIYESMWKEGPTTKSKNIDGWREQLPSSIDN